MRSYSPEFVSTISRIAPEEMPIIALEIDHPDLPDPIRVVNDNQDLTSQGKLFKAVSFKIVLPEDLESQAPKATLSVSNVGEELMHWIESSAGGKGATVRIIELMRSRPDLIEYETTMGLSNVTADMKEVSSPLGYENLLSKPSIGVYYRPDTHPGVF